MRILIALLIFAFTFTSAALAKGENPRDFHTWQVPTNFTQAAAPLQWDEQVFPSEIAFKNRPYGEMTIQPHRWFAGKYVLIEAGCGTSCQTGVLVNRQTGKVVPNSQLPIAGSGYDYRFNSALLVVNPTSPEILADRDYFPDQMTYYFAWTTSGWQEVAREPWPTATLTEAEKVQAALFGNGADNKKSNIEPETFQSLQQRDIPIPLPRPTKLSELFDSLR